MLGYTGINDGEFIRFSRSPPQSLATSQDIKKTIFTDISHAFFGTAHERPKRSGVVGQVRKLSAQIRQYEHDKGPLSCVDKLLDLNVGKPRWVCDSRHLRQ